MLKFYCLKKICLVSQTADFGGSSPFCDEFLLRNVRKLDDFYQSQDFELCGEGPVLFQDFTQHLCQSTTVEREESQEALSQGSRHWTGVAGSETELWGWPV